MFCYCFCDGLVVDDVGFWNVQSGEICGVRFEFWNVFGWQLFYVLEFVGVVMLFEFVEMFDFVVVCGDDEFVVEFVGYVFFVVEFEYVVVVDDVVFGFE